jgi:hypothetical protein
MASQGRAGVARWLVAMATVAVPLARRDWGRGMAAKLAYARSAARQDSTPGVLAMYGYVLAALMAAGALARRVSARPGTPVIAGLAAGLVIAVLAMATFAAIDNAFLSVVMHQQGKLDGFRDSDMTSMRAYTNSNLEATAPGMVLVWTVAGAVFASLGAALAREVAIARAQLPRLLRR